MRFMHSIAGRRSFKLDQRQRFFGQNRPRALANAQLKNLSTSVCVCVCELRVNICMCSVWVVG